MLSRYLDGDLSPEETKALERGLAAEPHLRDELAIQRSLQGLAESLPTTRAGFGAEDVLVSAGHRAGKSPLRGHWSRGQWLQGQWLQGQWPVAAAAVLLLAVSHAGFYLLGARATAPTQTSQISAIDETEQLLEQMAELDAAAPHERLDSQLVGLRGDFENRNLPRRLEELTSAEVPLRQRRRATQLVRHVGQLFIAFEQYDDPGFRAISVQRIAKNALGAGPAVTFVPATARSYERVTSLGGGRFRLVMFKARDGEPLVIRDEGTVEELQNRYDGLTIEVVGDER